MARASVHRCFINHPAVFSVELSIGNRRRRLPVAAKIALAMAGAIADVPGSPMPPGGSVLGIDHRAVDLEDDPAIFDDEKRVSNRHGQGKTLLYQKDPDTAVTGGDHGIPDRLDIGRGKPLGGLIEQHVLRV